MNKKLLLTTAIFCAFGASSALAAGYSTNLYSTSGLGNAYAGSAVGVHDASDIFFNPSTATNNKNTQFVGSVSYLSLNIKPKSTSNTSNNNGNATRDAGNDAVVPAFYLTSPINDKASFALSVNSPFGLNTEYDKNWSGRYSGIESSITSLNINPSVSYKITDDLSVGAGVQAQYMSLLMTGAVYTGGTDAYVKTKVNDWGYGYNLGLSFKASDSLKLGLGYRSKIDYKLTGKTYSTGLSGFGVDDGGYSATASSATPESITGGLAFKANDSLELLGDVTWTRWSRLKYLTINNAGVSLASLATATTSFNWKDSWLYSVGANYKTSDTLTVRSGLAFERDSVTAADRGSRIPTGDRYWATVGLSYKLNDSTAIDATYAHIFFKTVNSSNITVDTNGTSYSSKYKTSVDVLSLAVRKDF